MTVLRFSLKALFLTRVIPSPPASRLKTASVPCNTEGRIGEFEASQMSESGEDGQPDLEKLNEEKKEEDARVTSPLQMDAK
jgi:hypothetical protein